MSSRDVTIWTCDRCRVVVDQPLRKPNGDMNGLPDNWHHVETRPNRLNIDVCGDCFAALWTGWWVRSFDHVVETNR